MCKHKDKQWLELQLLACSDSIENYTHDDDDASQAALSKLTGLLEDTPRLESSTAVDRLLNVLTNIICSNTASEEGVTLAINALGLLSRCYSDVKGYLVKHRRAKGVYEIIIKHVKSESKYAVIASLACLSSLAVHDAVGAKIFSGANLQSAMAVAGSGLRRCRKDPRLALLGAHLMADLFHAAEVKAVPGDAVRSLLLAWLEDTATYTLKRALLRATIATINYEENYGGDTMNHALGCLSDAEYQAMTKAVQGLVADGETSSCWECWAMVAHVAGALNEPKSGAWDTSAIQNAARACWAAASQAGGVLDDQSAAFIVQAALLRPDDLDPVKEEALMALPRCLASDKPYNTLRALKLLARLPPLARHARLLASNNQKAARLSSAPESIREDAKNKGSIWAAHAAGVTCTEPPRASGDMGGLFAAEAYTMDGLKASMAKLELEKDMSLHEAQQLQVRVTQLEASSRELEDLRKRYEEQARRLNGAYNRLAQQAADSHRRAQDNTALAKKCADLREANTRLVEQLSASRESEEAAVKTMQTKVNDVERQRNEMREQLAQHGQHIQMLDQALARKDEEVQQYIGLLKEAEAQAQATQQALRQADAKLATQAAQIQKYSHIHQLVQSIHAAPDEGVGLGSS